MKSMKQTNRQYLTTLLNRIPKSEIQLQSKCAELLYFFYPDHWKRLVCVHNNSLKANVSGFGIVPGASDMYWLMPNGRVRFIEFKFGKNAKMSDAQHEWYAILKRLEHEYYICDTESFFWLLIELDAPVEADIEKLKWFA